MKSKNTKILLLALAITLSCSGFVLGQDSAALTVAPSAAKAAKYYRDRWWKEGEGQRHRQQSQWRHIHDS